MSQTKRENQRRDRFVECDVAYKQPHGVIYDREDGNAWIQSTVYLSVDECQ